MRTPRAAVPWERRAPARLGSTDSRAAARRSHLWAVALSAVLLASCTRNTTPGPPKVEPPPSAPALLGADALVPSSRLIVGRIVGLDLDRRFAFVELAADAPTPALAEGNEWITRTLDLRETGRVRVSRQVRGRTVGTTIVAGQPAPNDEVVWLAP